MILGVLMHFIFFFKLKIYEKGAPRILRLRERGHAEFLASSSKNHWPPGCKFCHLLFFTPLSYRLMLTHFYTPNLDTIN